MRLIVFSQFSSKDLQPFHENRNNCSEQSQRAVLIFFTKHTHLSIYAQLQGSGDMPVGSLAQILNAMKEKEKLLFSFFHFLQTLLLYT